MHSDFLPKSTIWKNEEMCNFYSEEAWWTISQPDDQCQYLYVDMNHVDDMYPW